MKKIVPYVILIGITLLFTSSFFHNGFFSTHDGQWAIIRLAEMEREIREGQIPPRWSGFLNHGYGYPLFLYTYPFPFYLGLLFRFMHIGLIDATKIVFILSVFLSGIFMYFLGKKLEGIFAGLISAIFYIIAPYRLVNLYVRGSIGESLSLALFPLLIYLGINYLEKQTRVNLFLTSIIFAILILTHNVMALFFLPIFIIFMTIMPSNNTSYINKIKRLIPVILIGLGLSSYFFIPAIIEKKYIILSQIKLADVAANFIKLPDYLFSPWNYGLKPSFQLGLYNIIAMVLGIFAVYKLKKNIRVLKLPVAIFIIFGMSVYIFLAHPISLFLWKYPPLSWLDFPWRLLGPLSFLLALAAVYLSINKITRIIGIILVIFALINNYTYSKPIGFNSQPDIYFATNDATTTSADELMPVWVVNKPSERYAEKIQIEKGDGIITELKYNSRMIDFNYASSFQSVLRVNLIYFPGWKFYIDDKELQVSYQNRNGLIKLDVLPGIHKINGRFERTRVRLAADTISIFCFLYMLVILFIPQKMSLLKFI